MAEIMLLHQQAFLSNKSVPMIDCWNTHYKVNVTIMQMWQSCYSQLRFNPSPWEPITCNTPWLLVSTDSVCREIP